jgi:hypothetical protein
MYKADVLSVQMLTYQNGKCICKLLESIVFRSSSDTITAHIFGWSESEPELCLGQAQTHIPQVHSSRPQTATSSRRLHVSVVSGSYDHPAVNDNSAATAFLA